MGNNGRLGTLLLALACMGPVTTQAERVKLTPIEKAQLPKYCWGRHVDPQYAAVAGYSIPTSCGKFMNHLCPGMMFLVAAQRVTDPPRLRRFNAQQAAGELAYTQRHMPPACPLHGDVEASIAMAKLLQKTLR